MHKHGMGRMYRDCLEVWGGGAPKKKSFLFLNFIFDFCQYLSSESWSCAAGGKAVGGDDWGKPYWNLLD